jgi:molybdopterin molybdotransferase
MLHCSAVLELEEALARILAAVPQPETERVPLSAAHQRFTAERVLAPIDLPSFTNSSMDGYAVRAADTAQARPEAPARLRIAGKVPAGSVYPQTLRAGECVRLFTGSPLPDGADAVVMQEDTRTSASELDTISVLTPVQEDENVRCRGEDVPKGAMLIERGEALTIGKLSLLAATGLDTIAVGRRPIVGVLATGSELQEPGEILVPGQIYESNRVGLAALIVRTGAQPMIFAIVRDAFEETRAALQHAFDTSDALVTSGGVSVGEMDFIKSAVEKNGGELDFWKVAVKPGRPFVFGKYRQKLLFGLPGNPVSALVTFLLLVRPALLRWQGAVDVSLPSAPAVLAETLINDGTRRHFFRVKLENDGTVRSTGLQASHALGSLAVANGLIDVPPQTRLEAGSKIRVLRWE